MECASPACAFPNAIRVAVSDSMMESRFRWADLPTGTVFLRHPPERPRTPTAPAAASNLFYVFRCTTRRRLLARDFFGATYPPGRYERRTTASTAPNHLV